MARTYFSASSTGESTTTSTTYGDKVALTLTAAQQAATTDYFILWSCLLKYGATSSDGRVRLRDDTAAANLQLCNIEPQDTSDYISVGGIAKWTSAGSPADNTFSIEFSSESSGTTTAVKEAFIVILKRETGDEYAETLGSALLASTWDDKVTLSFTPGSSGDYLFIGSCNLQPTATAEDSDVRLLDNASAGQRQRTIRTHDTSNFFPDMLVYKGTSLSGSQTWKLQGQYTTAGLNGCRMKDARLLALRLDTFPGTPQYAESNAASTKTGAGSGSHSTKASVTFTPNAKVHLIISTSHINGSSSTVSVAAQVAEDGSALQAEMLKEPLTSDTTAPLRESHHLFHFFTPTNASHTYATQYRNETTAITGAIAESAIAVLQIEASGGAFSIVPASVAWTSTATAVSLGLGREIVPAVVAWSWSATAVAFNKGKTLALDTLAWTSAVQDVSLEHGKEIVPANVAWSWTITDAALEKGWELVPAAVAWSYTVTDVSLERGFEVVADSVAWAFNVTDATFTHAVDKTIAADSVAWSFSVTDVSLEHGYELAADAVAWEWGAGDITFTAGDTTPAIRPTGGIPLSYEEWARRRREDEEERKEEDAPPKPRVIEKIGVAQPNVEARPFTPSPPIETGLGELTKSEIRRRARIAKKRRQEDDWFILN